MSTYDIVIVGAGVAGCALAHSLSTLPRPTPLRIALLERSLAEPDRIVGELLQPGGVDSLKELGMEDCLEGIDAVPVEGYCVYDSGKTVHIPYPDQREGRSFHHGKFINSLRAKAQRAKGVEVIEATVTELIECNFTKTVIGVKATRKDSSSSETFFADLTIIADGCFSNFRASVLLPPSSEPPSAKPQKALSTTKSHFVGLVLPSANLPIPRHGTVCLARDAGPVLFYQISSTPHETRMLVNVKSPVPSDLLAHIEKDIIPQMPSELHKPIRQALESDRLRRMPNSWMPAIQQGKKSGKEGVILIGDAWNMRHPLTGGGMTVAFNDVVLVRDLIGRVPDLGRWEDVGNELRNWHWKRKPLAATVNVLSVALYDLFGADDEQLAVLRTGCFKYFELGGECIKGPVSLLAAITPSIVTLFCHFFAVAFYSIWVMFTHPRPSVTGENRKWEKPGIDEYPELVVKSFRVFWTACLVFGPLLWTEVRWWGP